MVLSEINRTSSILRDIFDDSFKGIYVDDKMLLQEVKEYLDSIAPNKSNIVSIIKIQSQFLKNLGLKGKLRPHLEKLFP